LTEELDKKEHNKYERVILAAMRARELADGIDVDAGMEGKKITSIAMQELESGQLQFGDEDEEGEE
jgi:DNA-directed RNA polymerase omega subunit